MKTFNNASGLISPLVLVGVVVVIIIAVILFFRTPSTSRPIIEQESSKITVPILDN